MELCLEREGEFDAIGMVENGQKCGALGNRHYRYYVRIDATDTNLSPEGFIVENGRIHQYFINNYATPGRLWRAISCERMAALAAMRIGQRLLSEKISVTKVTVTIFGSNAARLTAMWRPGQTVRQPQNTYHQPAYA